MPEPFTINIPRPPTRVDRDGKAHSYPAHDRQGFDIDFGGRITLHFDDEAHAERLARLIARRLGLKLTEE